MFYGSSSYSFLVQNHVNSKSPNFRSIILREQSKFLLTVEYLAENKKTNLELCSMIDPVVAANYSVLLQNITVRTES